jgi:hypothetical protein
MSKLLPHLTYRCFIARLERGAIRDKQELHAAVISAKAINDSTGTILIVIWINREIGRICNAKAVIESCSYRVFAHRGNYV